MRARSVAQRAQSVAKVLSEAHLGKLETALPEPRRNNRDAQDGKPVGSNWIGRCIQKQSSVPNAIKV